MARHKMTQLRNGPHPLSLHVASSTSLWTGAAAGYPLFHLGGVQIHPDLQQAATDLKKEMDGVDQKELLLSIIKQAQSRLSDTLAGISAYQQHPYQRQVKPAALSHKIGTTELLDYGPNLDHDLPVVIVVPSLVNPAYILDLREDHSFMRFLASQDIHPYLIDWTAPAEEEEKFALEDYIVKRLLPLIRFLHKRHKKKIHIIGYCMGGNLSLAATQLLKPEDIIESLTLIATPWDFHKDQPAHLSALTDYFLKMELTRQHTDSVPMNIMQLFFFSLDPSLSDRKFRKFVKLDPDSSRARDFTAIEDWANDGCPLSSKVSKDCLINWYKENQPHEKKWTIAGTIIDPSQLTLSGNIITPTSDRIVPPTSAHSLTISLPHFAHNNVEGGHVSMIAGENAKTTLWPIIASKLK